MKIHAPVKRYPVFRNINSAHGAHCLQAAHLLERTALPLSATYAINEVSAMSKQLHCQAGAVRTREMICCCRDNHYDLALALNRIVFSPNESERRPASHVGADTSSPSSADRTMMNDFPRTCQDLQFFLKYGNSIICPTFLAYFADD
uniref:Uncharacterized protein n=1 Tax=Trichuris muris TaxID=70415 RepID=A0A5S6QBS7_TRIMR